MAQIAFAMFAYTWYKSTRAQEASTKHNKGEMSIK